MNGIVRGHHGFVISSWGLGTLFFFFKLAFVSDFSLLKARSYSITQAGTKIAKELA